MDYDPMLGKLIAWGADRDEAIARMRRALSEYYTAGIQTNTKLFERILANEEFLRADIHTKWLDERLAHMPGAEDRVESTQTARENTAQDAAALAAAVWFSKQERTKEAIVPRNAPRWRIEGRREQLKRGPDRE